MKNELTREELIVFLQAYESIFVVQLLLQKSIEKLIDKMIQHDQSKMNTPEIEIFAGVINKELNIKYGSQEYYDHLQRLRVAIKHHYAMNEHHPEHNKNGISGMNALDIVEMICDWMANYYLQSHSNDIDDLIEIQCERFHIDDQLRSIIKNTMYFLKD